MKIIGVSIWIWLLGVCVIGGAGAMALPKLREVVNAAMKPATLEVVQKDLWESARRQEVRGQIYNPRKEPARNVTVSFVVWKAKLGEDDVILHEPKGKAAASFEYLPAGGTVDFIAVSNVMPEKYESYGIDDGVFLEAGK